jgi:hypothetical protein
MSRNRNTALHHPPQLVVQQLVGRQRRPVRDLHRLALLGGLRLLERDVAGAAATVLHQRRVGGDAIEPGREGGLGLEVLEPAVGGEKCVLKRLGRVLFVPEDLERQPVDAVAIAIHELVERARVAALG